MLILSNILFFKHENSKAFCYICLIKVNWKNGQNVQPFKKMELEFIYYNENFREAKVSYQENQKQDFIDGFTRGVKWKTEKQNISFEERNTKISLCPLQTRPLILLMYDNNFGLQNNRCFVHELNGKLFRQIDYPGFLVSLNGYVRRQGTCWKLTVQESVGKTPIITCLMEQPINNGWGSKFATFCFDEERLSFGEPTRVWTEG